MIAIAFDHLAGCARNLLISLPNFMNVPWEQHVKNLKSLYDPGQDQLRTNLERLKQATNITEHIYKFDELMCQVTNMSNFDNYIIF
jgi:hypothetical protein